jgi:5-methyltetrahydropteroyltriglutamate--homocysteine methyltransferase
LRGLRAEHGGLIVMLRSTERVLTTHTGSLPRPPEVVELMLAAKVEARHAAPLHHVARHGENALDTAVRKAIADVAQKQIASGIDVISDGEQGRTDYTVHVLDRLTGYEGPSSPPLGTGEPEFPELSALLSQFASPFQHRPACNGPVGWKDFAAAEADIARSREVLAASGAVETFMTSPSPGQIARYLKNRHYPSEEAYMFALSEVMAREYRAIVDAGFILQLDCPDLAMSRHMLYPELSIAEYRKVIAVNVAALNHAVGGIPAERMRMHVCWGSTMGPHHTDVPLRDIVDIVLAARPQAVSFPGANPRHGHEWKVWDEVTLPDDKIIIPGVIDSTSNFVEHPELVADRIVQYANAVGRENVIAGVDCGFGTFAGRVQVDSKIVWMKLQSLAEGAALASRQLW